MSNIYAVIWQDTKLGGIPLTLKFDTAQEAIDSAQLMYKKAGDTLSGLRAVSLAPKSETLETLWKPDLK